MAELADALASGASSRKGVEVRVLSWAPFPNHLDVRRCAVVPPTGNRRADRCGAEALQMGALVAGIQ